MKEHNLEMLSDQPWEETLEFLTADMDPGNIDITVLADRYRDYIEEMQELDLSVSARAVRICAALLKMKTTALNYEEEKEQQENPMDFEEEVEPLEEETEDELSLEKTAPELEVPVRPKPRRRMQMDELKDALQDAMDVKERREERQEQRMEMDEQFEMNEETLNDRINSLFSRLTNLVSGGDEVEFDRLLDNKTNEEKIEKFLHVLHLENDEKVTCMQEEFLGELYVRPEEKPEGVAN